MRSACIPGARRILLLLHVNRKDWATPAFAQKNSQQQSDIMCRGKFSVQDERFECVATFSRTLVQAFGTLHTQPFRKVLSVYVWRNYVSVELQENAWLRVADESFTMHPGSCNELVHGSASMGDDGLSSWKLACH